MHIKQNIIGQKPDKQLLTTTTYDRNRVGFWTDYINLDDPAKGFSLELNLKR